MPSPNRNERPDGAGIRAIVLHHTAMAGTARDVGRYFARPEAKTSSHYIVDRSGYLVQAVDDSLRAWHAGRSEFLGQPDVNSFSIGIEICNLGDSQEPYPDAQYDAIIRLTAHLISRYDIPLTAITRHRDVAIPKGRKIDTSNNFSMERVNTGVRALLAGNYQSPALGSPPPQPMVPPYREIVVAPGQHSLKDLADIHLDNVERWVEIQALNPQILNPEQLQAGQKVKLPTDLRYYRGL